MPCYDGRDAPSHVSESLYAAAVAEAKSHKERSDELARMLCSLLTLMEADPDKSIFFALHDMEKSIKRWWSAHKAADAARLAREKEAIRRKKEEADARKKHHALVLSAVSKLTFDEQKALRQHLDALPK